MPTSVKVCRVCGKSYEACHTMNKVVGVFRWQEVACSPECGAEYLRRVMESRGQTTSAPNPNKLEHDTVHVEAESNPVDTPETGPVSEPEYQTSSGLFAETPIESE